MLDATTVPQLFHLLSGENFRLNRALNFGLTFTSLSGRELRHVKNSSAIVGFNLKQIQKE
jgi:hypothetical protein